MSTEMSQPMSVLTSHESKEWYTPLKYINLVRNVLGSIDLDPATCRFAQDYIKATSYRTIASEGDTLSLDWHGRVWLNPPYGISHGKSNQAVWSQKLVSEYKKGNVQEAILLVNSTHGYKWYEQLWTAYACCLLNHRIRFIDSEGMVGGEAKRGQTFLYMGANIERFMQIFHTQGRVLLPLC